MRVKEGLYKISRIISVLRNTMDILTRVAEVVITWPYIDCCSIRLLTPRGTLKLVAIGGVNWENREEEIDLETTIAGEAIGRCGEKPKVVVVRDISKDPRYQSKIASQKGLHSLMTVPIVFGGDVLGVIQFYLNDLSADQYRFGEDEEKWGAIVAAMIAPVIAREIERKGWRERFRITHAQGNISCDEKLSQLLQLACQTLGACRSCFWSLDLDTSKAKLLSGWDVTGNIGAHGIGEERKIATTPTFQALVDGADFLHIAETQKDRRTRYMLTWARKMNIVANVFFSVKWGGKIIGILVVDRNDCRSAFGEWDFEIGEDFAQNIAVIMSQE